MLPYEQYVQSLHFLPLMYIVCIEKSSIVPRMIHALSALNRSVEEGKRRKVPSTSYQALVILQILKWI